MERAGPESAAEQDAGITGCFGVECRPCGHIAHDRVCDPEAVRRRLVARRAHRGRSHKAALTAIDRKGATTVVYPALGDCRSTRRRRTQVAGRGRVYCIHGRPTGADPTLDHAGRISHFNQRSPRVPFRSRVCALTNLHMTTCFFPHPSN